MTHRFFLGGHDLEMLEIGRLVAATLGADAVVDKGLPWHAAAASAYAAEIAAALEGGLRPVLVELRPDLEGEVLARCLVVDHHGERAGADQPTSLEQVFALLGLPPSAWTRRQALVAANDRGWIPELRAMGASAAEIAAIRAEDRAAQGVSPAEEAAAATALEARESRLGGSLTLVRLPHGRTSPVFDRLALEAGPGAPPSGARVTALARAYPAGWSGGALPARGFWGHGAPLPALDRVLAVIEGA